MTVTPQETTNSTASRYRRRLIVVAVVAGIVLMAAACSSKGYRTTASTTTTTAGAGGSGGAYGAGASSTTAGGTTAKTDLSLATTSLGPVVVDSTGHTLYLYLKDTAATPTCTGACAKAWPPATVTGSPTASADITGTVTVAPAADGTSQLVLDGHPLYRYAADGAPGDVNGQGVGSVWYAVTASGQKAG
jgi:predicted lipoprotein with Yx(FWY)xxD motif